MTSIAWFSLAALCEIAGCFAFWGWLKLDKPLWWTAPGVAALVVFAVALTRVDAAYAGRAYAAYGGAYILASILWLALVERQMPDRWDLIGAGLAIAGAGVIIFGPRGA